MRGHVINSMTPSLARIKSKNPHRPKPMTRTKKLDRFFVRHRVAQENPHQADFRLSQMQGQLLGQERWQLAPQIKIAGQELAGHTGLQRFQEDHLAIGDSSSGTGAGGRTKGYLKRR